MSDLDKALLLRDAMDDMVSPTFCFAKWHHSTIYLQLGQTHSCYHPPPHEIKLDEIMKSNTLITILFMTILYDDFCDISHLFFID